MQTVVSGLWPPYCRTATPQAGPPAALRWKQKSGITVSYTAVVKYLRIPPFTPSETVLEDFSAVFEIPMIELRKAAAVSPGETESFILPERANRLTQPQRQAVLHLIRVLLDSSDTD